MVFMTRQTSLEIPSRLFAVLHKQTTNAYLVFQGLAFVGSGFLATKITERERRKAIAGSLY